LYGEGVGKMNGFLVGLILGVFLGVGVTAGYIAYCERKEQDLSEDWIGEAFERAFDAVDNRIEEA
jgi:hypothetical protein